MLPPSCCPPGCCSKLAPRLRCHRLVWAGEVLGVGWGERGIVSLFLYEIWCIWEYEASAISADVMAKLLFYTPESMMLCAYCLSCVLLVDFLSQNRLDFFRQGFLYVTPSADKWDPMGQRAPYKQSMVTIYYHSRIVPLTLKTNGKFCIMIWLQEELMGNTHRLLLSQDQILFTHRLSGEASCSSWMGMTCFQTNTMFRAPIPKSKHLSFLWSKTLAIMFLYDSQSCFNLL